MPQIDFDQKAPLSEIANLIWGHMQFPRDTDRSFELFAKLHLLQSIAPTTPNTTPITLPASWVKALLLGPSLKELQKGGAIRERQGVSAGALLWAAYLYEQQPGKKITLNKAIECVIRQVEGKRLAVLGLKPYPNKAELHTSWKEMRNVAHLWAGFLYVQIDIRLGIAQASFEALNAAMAIAQAISRWGGQCMVPGQGGTKAPLLDASQLWLLPDFVLPIELQPMPSSELPAFVTDPILKR